MKKLSQRVTVGLILFAVGLTGLLAYRAFDASRAHRQMTEQTLRDYAGFAAFQLKNATIGRITGQHRQAGDQIARWVVAHGPTPPLGARRVAEFFETTGRQCRCLDSVSFYYQLTFADSGIEASASDIATPENLRRIRDTVISQAMASARRGQAPSQAAGTARGVPLAPLFLVAIFSRLSGRPYLFMQTVAYDPTGNPSVAYGYAAPAGHLVGTTVMAVLRSQPVLPTTLTRGLRTDSLLAVRVSDAGGASIYQTAAIDERFAVTDTLPLQQGGLRFQVAINPAAADRLIIGGVPKSRLPEVLATAFVAVGLLVLLLYQFRRQEELGRLRDDFVSGVSHELRTPLAQIRLLAELLRMEKVPTEEKRERSLRIIDQEARRLSFLVESILSFTHAKPGKLAPVRIDVAAEIEEIVDGFEPLAQANEVRLTTRLERGIIADVDRGALRQILLNLLDNAVRYGPPGQNVTIATTSAPDNWTLEVTDEGPGIPADESEKVFDPYYRMKRDAGGAVGGTGIGLAVVRRLVQQHGGRVHVASINGNGVRGARLVVALPVTSTTASGR